MSGLTRELEVVNSYHGRLATSAWLRHVMVPLIFSACIPEFEQVQGEHILYENSDELEPCVGNAAYLDAAVPFMEGQLAAVAPEPLRYSWLTEEDIPGWVDRDVGGVHLAGAVVGQHVWAERPVLIHEVAHLVAAGRQSAPFFKEGIAVAMDIFDEIGSGPRYFDVINFDPRTTMTASEPREVDYTAAGLFVSFILVRHGPERLREFYRSLAAPFTLKRLDAAFQRVYGVTLDAEAEAFMKGPPPCDPGYFNLQVIECSGPTVGWESEQTWRLAETLACDTPGVVGGLRPERAHPSFHAVTLEVSLAGVYMLGIDTPGHEFVRMGPCFGCPWDFADTIVFANEMTPVRLAAGKYYVRVNGMSDEANDVDAWLRYLY